MSVIARSVEYSPREKFAELEWINTKQIDEPQQFLGPFFSSNG